MARSQGTRPNIRLKPQSGGRYHLVHTIGCGLPGVSVPVQTGKGDHRASSEKIVELNQGWAEAIFNLNQQTGLSQATLLDVTLDELVRLSRSTVGHFHLISHDQKTIQLSAWSKAVRAQGSRGAAAPATLAEGGAWADCVRLGKPVIHNEIQRRDQESDPLTGQLGLVRHAGIPIFDRGRIVAVLGVGNKTEPYTEMDVARLSLAAYNLWVVLKHRQAEKALHTSEEIFRHFVEQSGDGIVLIDSQGIVVEWNDARVQSTGISREDAIGQPIWDVHSWIAPIVDSHKVDEWLVTTRRQILDALNTGTANWLGRRIDWEVIHQGDRSRRILEITAFPIETSQGRILGSVSRDITERRKTNEELGNLRDHFEELVEQRTAELQLVNEQLEALSHVKDEFVSNVSHELRTPITSLKLHQHLLRHHPEELIDRLDIMGRETDRLAATIEQLLELSRLDQGRTALQLADVDLNRMVSRYVTDRAPLTQGLSLGFKAAEQLPRVVGDENLLGELLEILLTNAVKYTPAGGVITVSTQTRRSGRHQQAGFSVADTGPGIDPSEKDSLFERFYRGKAGRASQAHGSGLGLAIAREIVERHSGEIEVDSTGKPGEGTTFSVWLPAREK